MSNTTTHPRPLALETFLPYRLAVTAEAVSHGLSAVYAETFDLNIAEWRIIANLGRFGTLTAGVVALQSTLDKPKVTRALHRLTRRRLVSRKTDKADRRAVTLTLTTEGQSLYTEIAGLARAWEQELLRVLTKPQQTALFDMLHKLETRAVEIGDATQLR